MRKKIGLIIAIFTSAAVWLVAPLALAQDFGINVVNNTINLSQADPRLIIGRIIQIALSFLAALAVVIIMYAGFKWMTSGGDEEKIGAARRTLRDAVIGLIIIMVSWAVVTFVLSQLTGIFGGTGSNVPASGGTLGNSGLAAVGACTVESFYPTGGQTDVPRNTSIMITFKNELRLDSVCVNASGASCACDRTSCNKLNPKAVDLYKTDLGNSCASGVCSTPNTNVTDVIVTVPTDHKTLVLTPSAYLGSPTENTPYTIRFTNNVKDASGASMFQGCGNNFAEWNFTVSSRLDLTPPIVNQSGVFPAPDNVKDGATQVTPAVAAAAEIDFNDCPNIYSPATVQAITPATANVKLDYHGSLAQFKIAVPASAPDTAQLFDGGSNALLGIATFSQAGQAVFPNFLTLTAASHAAGSAWAINISPEQLADTLNVDNQIYTFASSSLNNNISVPSVCDKNQVAANAEAKLSGDSGITVSRSGNRLNLVASVAGTSGNDIVLQSTNNSALSLKPFSGGTDQITLARINDHKDNPMNSVIQINFDKAVNPVTVSGSAGDIGSYLRIVNAATSSPAGAVCASNSDCQSYKCSAGVCVGDYLNGKFMISNGYKTVEFLSDQQCGVNGCGEKIYCLPANSHLAVQLVAANLKSCATAADCLSFAPYKNCSSTPLGYNTCQNDQGQNYPTATSSLDGIVDAAMNSLDGNRDASADGPLSFFNENNVTHNQPILNKGQKDKFLWSFYVNNQIMSASPILTMITPTQSQSSLGLADPVSFAFNELMMNSTLLTGSALEDNGTGTIEHKLVNLSSLAPSALGYWIFNDNTDTPPLDGVPDVTVSQIMHSPFLKSFSYKAQVGSGVKDIYQNCYKPSAGPNCQATASQPSCCFGATVSGLTAAGNCP